VPVEPREASISDHRDGQSGTRPAVEDLSQDRLQVAVIDSAVCVCGVLAFVGMSGRRAQWLCSLLASRGVEGSDGYLGFVGGDALCMWVMGIGKPIELSPYGQSRACTARSTAPPLLACRAAHPSADLPEGELSSPTTISFLIRHLRRAGSHRYTFDGGARVVGGQLPFVVASEDLRPRSVPRPSTAGPWQPAFA
jgi:hypothetical protein